MEGMCNSSHIFTHCFSRTQNSPSSSVKISSHSAVSRVRPPASTGLCCPSAPDVREERARSGEERGRDQKDREGQRGQRITGEDKECLSDARESQEKKAHGKRRNRRGLERTGARAGECRIWQRSTGKGQGGLERTGARAGECRIWQRSTGKGQGRVREDRSKSGECRIWQRSTGKGQGGLERTGARAGNAGCGRGA